MPERWPLRGKVAIVGVGYSEIGRRLSRPLGLLAKDAVLAAIEDAGLAVGDIDGASTHPDMPVMGTTGGATDGIDVVTVGHMIGTLGIGDQVRWYGQNSTGLMPTSIIAAVDAIAAGACDTAVVWRAMHMPRGRYDGWESDSAGGMAQFYVPYGVLLGATRVAMDYRAYMNRYGASREHLGTYLVNNRLNAHLNPRAYFRDTPLSMDDYLNARVISDPMTLFDCDLPLDGCAAVVLTRADRAQDLRHPPAYIRGYGQTTVPDTDWTLGAGNLEHIHESGRSAAEKLWRTSGLGPRDVQAAMLYDGFSPFILFWLEAMGFCERGEAWRFVSEGRTNIGAELPVTTSGGSLGEGRLHGFTHLAEAVYQVTGRAGKRQVKDAEHVVMTVGMLTMMSSGLVISASAE